MAKWWNRIQHAQVICERCDELSPVVAYSNKGSPEARIISELLEQGWEVTKDLKCYCPVCRRIGG